MTRFNTISRFFNKALHNHFRMLFLPTLLLIIYTGQAQNVGIGTSNPLRKLSVTGSILVDQNSNNTGDLDSAALVFGNNTNSGISSNKAGGGADANNLRFWTGGISHMNLSPIGNLAVGGNYSPAYRLWVRNGNSRFDGSLYAGGALTALGNAAIGGDLDADYRLRVWDGNTRFGGDMHATGNTGIGGLPDNNFRLRVYNGSTYLDGTVQITGHTALTSIGASGNISSSGTVTADNVNVNNSLTIDGKGSVRSNGPSPLRIGFDKKTVNVFIANNNSVSVTANITDFSGDNDDVRVFVSQVTGGGGISWINVRITIMDVDPVTDTCTIWLDNDGGGDGIISGTIYLTTIAKN